MDTIDEHSTPTADDVRGAFSRYLKQRADAGVFIAKSADVSFDDGVVTVVFYPAASVGDPAILMEVTPFENHADFPGTIVSFDNPEGRWLRKVVKRVDTFLGDGTDLGSRSVAELYKMGTGWDLTAE